jgi:class 3 adenylate cyclase/streptogramin lyase
MLPVLERRGGPARLLATVFFTDMVGSTERAAEMGDRHWREVLATYHRVVDRALRSSHGREMDSAGDGFFAVFEQPADAIACAEDIADHLEPLGIKVRSGVHLGQVEVQGKKVSGIGVHIGARLVGLAAPGEILLSSTARDALAGSDHAFVDRGTHTLKGVPGEWRLFALVRTPRQVALQPPPTLTEPPPRRLRRTIALRIGAVALIAAGASIALIVMRHGSSPQAPAVPVVPGTNQVAEFAVEGQSFVTAIDVGEGPVGVVDTGTSVWVINSRSQTLTRIDKATMKPQSYGVGGTPAGIAYAGGSVWVTAGFGTRSGAPGSLLRFDAADGTQMPSITLSDSDGWAGIAADGQTIWVTNERTNKLVKVDAQSGTVGDPIDVGGEPKSVAIGAGSVWVANSLDHTVSRVDQKTGKVSPPISVDGADVITADDTSVWVAGTASNKVMHIDPATDGIVTTIEVLPGPLGLGLTANDVWVADGVSGEVVRIDRSSGAIADRLTTHGHPSAIDPQRGSVWVTVAD